MSNNTSLGQRLRADLTGNLLVSVLAVVIGALALGVFASLGMGYDVLFGLAVTIGVFVPRVYERYWSSTRESGFRIGWTILMSLYTMAIFLGGYTAAHHFVAGLYAGVVAFVITIFCQFGAAILLTGRQPQS